MKKISTKRKQAYFFQRMDELAEMRRRVESERVKGAHVKPLVQDEVRDEFRKWAEEAVE